MQFVKPETEFFCGVDLHWHNQYVCIVSKGGDKLVHRKLRNDPEIFLKVVSPYLPSVTVSCESTGSWYWLADLCSDHAIPFALGHVLYMKAIHGAKSKNDKIDSEKIARLTQSGLLPKAYAHPRELRATRDALRRRLKYVQQRSGLMSHIKCLGAQNNLESCPRGIAVKGARSAVADRFADPDDHISVACDVAMIEHYDQAIADLEAHVMTRTKELRKRDVALLMTAPGVGRIIALTIVLEMHDIARFATRQDFASYSRLVRCNHTSNGKVCGTGGSKIGNPYLKWAFCEAAVHAPRGSERIAKLLDRLERDHGLTKGKVILAHKLGRAFYFMLKNGTAFDEDRFLTRR